MASTSNKPKILFVVEGAVAEEKFLRQFESFIPLDISEDIITYKTNIYQLYNHLFREGEGADLKRVLLCREKDDAKKALLNQRFAEIYLLFDYDLHDPQYSDEKIIRLMNYFNNSTENGLLLINYPMLESYRHLKSIPDKDFRYRKIALSSVRSYKYIVRKEECFETIPNKRVMLEIVRHNVDKMNYINHRLVNIYQLKGNIEDELVRLLKEEIELKNKRKLVNVLNTGALFGYAYAPKKMALMVNEYMLNQYGE